MTISVWRYSHLALAVSSFLFIILAAVTGIILSFEPVSQKFPSYRTDGIDTMKLSSVIPVLSGQFEEITELKVDVNGFVIVDGIDADGNTVLAYVDPSTGKVLGEPKKQKPFFQWITSLHRSLFLHETGRFFVGLTAFLLMLIAISGTILVIQRQRGFKRFFSKIIKENWAQYYHVVLGRLALIPIILIALTGTWLSLVRFGIFPEKKITHAVNLDGKEPEVKKKAAEFPVFREINLGEVQSIEYPFSDDPEDYYTLKLDDRELVVDQFAGETISEVAYPTTVLLTNLSLDLHTGRRSIIWAIILAIASVNILFFIYSGFVITLKRTRNKIRNKYKAAESRFIILAGSENGSTLRFAHAVQQQLIAQGQAVHLAQLDDYTIYPKAEFIIILTSTYGLGNPPANGSRFLAALAKLPQARPIKFSVLGFGSHAYPDFCRFAFDIHNEMSRQPWATALQEIHTVNDKSPEQFSEWFSGFSQLAGFSDMLLPVGVHVPPTGLQTLQVVSRTTLTHEEGSFILTLKPRVWRRFSSGSLLTVYPANDHRERQYSIGRIGRLVQLSVKLHAGGLGSGYLYNLQPGDQVRARIAENEAFRFPRKAKQVIMICHGTGIAPFLGMIDENSQKTECHLYTGFRNHHSFDLYKEALNTKLNDGRLTALHLAYSREGNKMYVSELLQRDAVFISSVLENGGTLMLCGSLSMQNDVIAVLETICLQNNKQGISYYQSHGQVLMDCY